MSVQVPRPPHRPDPRPGWFRILGVGAAYGVIRLLQEFTS